MFLVAFSGLDIRVSRLFFDHGFFMASQGWTKLLHVSVPWFVFASMACVAAVYGFNRLWGRHQWGIDGKKVVYLLLVLALGAGFLVNGMLKNEFGRARPRDILEFGGTAHFTPAYVISTECSRNCSFSSGDAAGAFFALAFLVAVSRKRVVTTVAVGYGVLVSAARIASGAHFLSDNIVSFFIMLLVADALYYRMFLFDPGPAVITLAPAPALAIVPVPAVIIGTSEKPSASR